MDRSSFSAAGAGPALAALLLAGCAGPAAPPSGPAPGDATARTCQQVTGGAPWHGLLRVRGDQATLDAHDDYFSPSCLVVPAGRPVTLVLTDQGSLPHTLDGAAVSASVDAGGTAFVHLPGLQRPARLVCGLHADHRMVLAVVPEQGGGTGHV